MENLEQFLRSRREKLEPYELYTNEQISAAEQRLGVSFPDDLKVVLREIGGGHHSNFVSLDDEYGIVGWTERYRSLFNLPPEYIVLIEDGDVGMTLIHLPTGTTYWIGLYDYEALIAGRPLHDPYIYHRYGDLVIHQIKKYEQEEAGDNDE